MLYFLPPLLLSREGPSLPTLCSSIKHCSPIKQCSSIKQCVVVVCLYFMFFVVVWRCDVLYEWHLLLLNAVCLFYLGDICFVKYFGICVHFWYCVLHDQELRVYKCVQVLVEYNVIWIDPNVGAVEIWFRELQLEASIWNTPFSLSNELTQTCVLVKNKNKNMNRKNCLFSNMK